eukprot:scaffold913_cov233-Pinguiococcus_pyrenoidosus.AAC.6
MPGGAAMESGAKDYYKRSLSSLPLQVLVYFNGWFSTLFFLLALALFLYKRYSFFYAGNSFAWDLTMLFFLSVVDFARLFLASKGNKTEHAGALLWFICLTAPICVGYAYLLTLQTYVLRLDVVLCSLGLAFVGLEGLIGIFTCVQFMRAYREALINRGGRWSASPRLRRSRQRTTEEREDSRGQLRGWVPVVGTVERAVSGR